MAYPGNLEDLSSSNDIVDGTSIVQAVDIDTLNVMVDSLQGKVGIDGSAVTSSLDYKVEKEGVKQVVNVTSSAVATGSTSIPLDDTIPQNTEGDEHMTRAITPTDSGHALYIEAVVIVSPGSQETVTVALFQDSTAGALAVVSENIDAGRLATIVLRHKMTASTTSSTNFKIRIGGASATTITFNGVGGVRKFGGVASSNITIIEVKA